MLNQFLPITIMVAALTSCSPDSHSDSVVLDDNSETKLHELATGLLLPEFEHLLSEFTIVDDEVLPHEVKGLRKKIGNFRLTLDLFPYVYNRDDDVDGWQELRDVLDDGYEAFGKYKDIFDEMGLDLGTVDPSTIEYDEEELQELRPSILAWTEYFKSEHTVQYFNHWLSHPLTDDFVKRKKKSLSRFLWGGVDIKPKKSKSGVQNIRRMISAQLEESEKIYDEIISIKKIAKEKNEIEFHDFRKRLRNAVKLLNDPYGIGLGSGVDSDRLTLLALTVDKYGDVNDLFLKYHKAQKNDDERKAKRIKKDIENQWKDLVDWQKDMKIHKVLKKTADL